MSWLEPAGFSISSTVAACTDEGSVVSVSLLIKADAEAEAEETAVLIFSTIEVNNSEVLTISGFCIALEAAGVSEA